MRRNFVRGRSGNLSGLGKLRKLAVVVMHDLQLSGPLPPSLCGVFQCDAHGNRFDCPLPKANGTATCCGVKRCGNDDADETTQLSLAAPGLATVAGGGAAAGGGGGLGRRLQADPGDTRPYGPGYECHCHTPPPR